MIFANLCRRGAATGAVSATRIGRTPDGEFGALLQRRHAAVTWLGNADKSWRIVERVDADVDDLGRALAGLVGGITSRRVSVGVGIV